ncbi:hypothetical protein C8A05DRAFT_18912 [Staphylotrichum tortipilum]|uniref:Uncharacterized protein n=1 Tax=Staphylotrichum tortipilum TaxID=2831512 RepID=A0AAN6MEB9_9PEZI|nr:hypothetical protein C8A05DRAFT_18912 [Staphylotrichum longicolle]
MYRTKHLRWKLMHIWGILVHLFLVVAATIGFLCDLSKPYQLERWEYLSHPTATALHPCRFHAAIESNDGLAFNKAARIGLLKITLGLGTSGLVITTALFALLLRGEKNRIALTEGEQHWRKQVLTLFACLLNLLLAGAGASLTVVVGINMKMVDSKALIAPLIWASLQAPLMFSIAVCDAVKNYREGRDLLD